MTEKYQNKSEAALNPRNLLLTMISTILMMSGLYLEFFFDKEPIETSSQKINELIAQLAPHSDFLIISAVVVIIVNLLLSRKS